MAPTNTILLLGPPRIDIYHLPSAAATIAAITTTTTTTTTKKPTKKPTNKSPPSFSFPISKGAFWVLTEVPESEPEPEPERIPSPIRGYTENKSPTYLNTGNPCLDFFFKVVPSTPPSSLTQLLQNSWSHDPLITLKLICNLRGVRGTGKSDKEGFYTAVLWLHTHHPKTLALNIKPVSEFGYLKDLPEILFRLLEGSQARAELKLQSWSSRRFRGFRGFRKFHIVDDNEKEEKEKEKEKARVLRLKRKNERGKKAFKRYRNDPKFQLLYDCISDHFAELLKNDIEFLKLGELNKIGLAAKWCPTLDSTYDEVTLLCESIARRVFPKDDYDEYKGIKERHYAFRVRDRLRKEVLVPLRKALELPEVYMSAKKWDALPYNRVPSVAMKLYKSLFYKHDKERFKGYLEEVKSGKATIAAGALLPHEIIASLNDIYGGEVAELQWKRMVDDLAKKGKLSNCMAICDVSGSMFGTPMEVSVALGLLISELSEDPWKGKLITFSANPQFHIIKGETLLEKTEFIREMDLGMNTDFQKVFDRILEVAVKGKIPEEQMIKRVFVFSDMEFDEASTSNAWETDYMVIQRKFKEKGYEKVPEIVFWNLRHSMATPVPSTQPGVALVSGFSKNLVSLFLEEGGIINPEAVMLEAIAKPEYEKLVVYD